MKRGTSENMDLRPRAEGALLATVSCTQERGAMKRGTSENMDLRPRAEERGPTMNTWLNEC